MFFIKAYRDVPATAHNKPVDGTTKPQSTPLRDSACYNQRDLVTNRVKAFISIDERSLASLPNLNNDTVYRPLLRQVPDWLTQERKCDPAAIKIPAWLRCDACQLFFMQPFCLPCCNSIICKHCMHTLRRDLYSSPDYLSRKGRRVPDPAFPCPLCKVPLHGTQIDGWNNSMTRMELQVTIRHNNPGAHELTVYPKEKITVLAEENSNKEKMHFPTITPSATVLDEDNDLDTSLHHPNGSLSVEQKITETSGSSQTSYVDKHIVTKLDSPSQPKEIYWRTLPIVVYGQSPHERPIVAHRNMATTRRCEPIKLNPSMKRTSADVGSGFSLFKRPCIGTEIEISPLYLGVTPDTALGPWKTSPRASIHPDDLSAAEDASFGPVILSDNHPFSIQNQFRMSTEFASLWRSYYQVDAKEEMTAPDDHGENTKRGEEEIEWLEEGEDSVDGMFQDFDFETVTSKDELGDEDVHISTDFFQREFADWSKDAEKNLRPHSSHSKANKYPSFPPHKTSKHVNITPEKQNPSEFGLLTPPNSASSTQDELQQYPSPTPSWDSISSAPSTPTPTSPLKPRQSITPNQKTIPSQRPRNHRQIKTPLATPTQKDHSTYLHRSQPNKQENRTPFNLNEQLNDRKIYTRTLNIQRHILTSSRNPSIPASHKPISRRKRYTSSKQNIPENSPQSDITPPLENIAHPNEDTNIQGSQEDNSEKRDLSHRTCESLQKIGQIRISSLQNPNPPSQQPKPSQPLWRY